MAIEASLLRQVGEVALVASNSGRQREVAELVIVAIIDCREDHGLVSPARRPNPRTGDPNAAMSPHFDARRTDRLGRPLVRTKDIVPGPRPGLQGRSGGRLSLALSSARRLTRQLGPGLPRRKHHLRCN